jgi:hypothetical protein
MCANLAHYLPAIYSLDINLNIVSAFAVLDTIRL